MFVGSSSDLARMRGYKAKIRAYSGTGPQGDYTPPVVQHKLSEMYRKAQQVFSDQSSYQNAVSALVGSAGIIVGVRVPAGNGSRF